MRFVELLQKVVVHMYDLFVYHFGNNAILL
jgi:hypothetical protein